MYEELDVGRHRSASPPLFNSLTEIPRTLFEISALVASLPMLSMLPRGDGHQVLLLPGFMAGDESTAVLRRYLRHMGYAPAAWNLGRNTGKPEFMQRLVPERVESLLDSDKSKISIIGQSLGGVYAREIARMYPNRIRSVITLGSPFGTRDSGSALAVVSRLFEQEAGLSVEEMRNLLLSDESDGSPPVPFSAIFSKGDGIVNWRACKEGATDGLTENIEVCGSHCGMGFNAMIYYIVADRLSQEDGKWQKWQGFANGNSRIQDASV